MANYCENADLEKEHPGILEYGVSDWADQLTESTTIINRALDFGWYRKEAESRGKDWQSTPFDQDLLLEAEAQLTRLAVFKTLELAFRFLMKNVEDTFDNLSNRYGKEYKQELKDVLRAGLDYDFNEDGEIQDSEKTLPTMPRTLGRM